MKLAFTPYYARQTCGLPVSECLNVFSEAAPPGTIFIGRPALTRRTINVGTGPIRGLERQPGVAFDNEFSVDGLMIVSGQELYRRATLVGAIAGSSQVRFAALGTQLIIVAPDVGKAYVYDAVSHGLAQVTDPDLPEVSDVFVLDSRAYYQEKNTDRFWFSALGDATSVDGLAFETAEAKPDSVVRSTNFRSLACFFGKNSIEVFSSSGDQNAPLTPQVSLTSNRGLASADSLCLCDNALFFVADDRTFRRYNGGEPETVSHSGINECLRKCNTIEACTAYAQSWDGHQGVILNIPDGDGAGSYFFDLASKGWFHWQSRGNTGLRLSCGIMYGGDSYLGDDTTGQIWRLNPEGDQDYQAAITRTVTAFLPVESGNPRCDVISLQCVRGVGDAGSAPQVEMQYSDDQGRTWSQWKARSLGQVGQYREKAVWRGLGVMRSPGRHFHFRSSDNVNFVAESMTVDEQRP